MENQNQQTEVTLRESDFIEIDGELYMPIRDIATAIGYKNDRSLWKIYDKNREELEQYSRVTETVTEAGKRQVVALSELGCYTIAFFAKTEKAQIFRREVAKLMQKVRITKEKIAELEEKYNTKLEIELAKLKETYNALDEMAQNNIVGQIERTQIALAGMDWFAKKHPKDYKKWVAIIDVAHKLNSDELKLLFDIPADSARQLTKWFETGRHSCINQQEKTKVIAFLEAEWKNY